VSVVRMFSMRCDVCGDGEEEFSGPYSEDIRRDAKAAGWKRRGAEDICPDCLDAPAEFSLSPEREPVVEPEIEYAVAFNSHLDGLIYSKGFGAGWTTDPNLANTYKTRGEAEADLMRRSDTQMYVTPVVKS